MSLLPKLIQRERWHFWLATRLITLNSRQHQKLLRVLVVGNPGARPLPTRLNVTLDPTEPHDAVIDMSQGQDYNAGELPIVRIGPPAQPENYVPCEHWTQSREVATRNMATVNVFRLNRRCYA